MYVRYIRYSRLPQVHSALAAGIVKITYLGSYGKHSDFLWDSVPITIWTTVEICTAISAASAPCLKPLFRHMLHSSFFSSIRNHGSDNGKGYPTYEERTTASKAGLELQYRGQVSSGGPYHGHGKPSRRTESEEEIIRPEDGMYISKSVSVSVI